MEAEGAIVAALNDVRADFPAMRVRTEHVVLDGPLTVFRATIMLPTGAEATGYGSVAGSGVEAIALAEARALARAMALLGVDQDAYDGRVPRGGGGYEDRDDDGSDEPYLGSGLYQAVADESPADPYNLGTSPSAAAVASATGMRLGARSVTADRPGAEPEDDAAPPGRPAAQSRTAAPPERPVEPEPTSHARRDDSASAAEANAPDPAPASPIQNDSDEDAGVSHQAFWRWAGERGLSNRTDVEDLIGQSIGGMRPAAVRDLIIGAQEGSEDDA